MNIGILGSGVVAKTLAAGFLKHGHSVTVGTRDPKKLAEWNAEHSSANVGTFDEAASFGDVLVLAVHGSAAADVLHLAGSANLKGKFAGMMRRQRRPRSRSSISSVGKSRTWGRPRPRAPSSCYASCGASPDSFAGSGCTRSSYCASAFRSRS